MKIRFALGILFFFAISDAQAEINKFKSKTGTIRAFVEIPSYTLEIKSKVSKNGDHAVWAPNLRTLAGADISLNGVVGVGVTWANGDDAASKQKKGDTEYIDYRLGLTLDHFHGDANFQQYKGFYLDNTTQVAPNFSTTGDYIKDRTMLAQNSSVNGIFILSPQKFSYAAALDQSARQEVSGGSILLGFAGSHAYFSSDDHLIPQQIRSRFGEDQTIKQAQFQSLALKAGYGVTLAWTRKFFTSVVVIAGFGEEFRTYKDDTRETKSGGGIAKAEGLFSFGFNGDDFLIAVIASGDGTTYTTESLEIPATIGDAKIAIGAHF